VRTPLVLLHGFLGCGEDWRTIMRDVLRDRPCFAIELPGHGAEPTPLPADFEACVRWLAEGLETTVAHRCDLLGYSMGGRLALALAARCPGLVRRVAVIGASAGLGDAAAREARRALDEQRAVALERGPFTSWLEAWYGQPLFAPLRASAGYDAMLERRQRGQPASLAAALRVLSVGCQPPLGHRLAMTSVPLLLVAGAEDVKYTASNRRLASRRPGIDALTVPGAGHAPHLEQPDEFRRALGPWLDRP